MTKIRDIVLYEKGKAPAAISNDELVLYLSPEYLRGKTSPVMVPRQSNFIQVSDGDIILLWDGSNAGEFFRGKKGVLASTMVRVVFSENTFDRNFLYHQFKYIEPKLKAKTSGSGIPHVDKQILGDFEILRISPSEQTRIAGILSTVDAAIEQTEALIAKYQRIKTGLMQDLLTRGIDEHGRIRSKTTHSFEIRNGVLLPTEWKVKSLGELAEISSGITLGKKYEGPDTVEFPYLRVANVQDGYLDLREITTIRIPQNQVEKYLLKHGDVLMNEGGDFDKLGRGTIWRNEIQNCLHQNHVFKVRCKLGELLPDYLTLVSASPYGKRFFVLSSKQSTNLASINSTQLKSFPIPLPDVEEQKRIVQMLGSKAKVAQTQLDYLHKLQALKKGLMQDLLSGKRRVTVEPVREEISEMVNTTE